MCIGQNSNTIALGALVLVKMCVLVDMAMGNEFLVF